MSNDHSPHDSAHHADATPASMKLDRAIDRAVRQMMRVDPPAGLRRRVLARLEAPPRRAVLVPRLAFAAAALAVLVLSVTMLRDRAVPERRDVPVAVAANRPAQIETPAPAPPLAPVPPPRETVRTTARATRERIAMPPIANVFGTRDGRAAAANAGDAAATAAATEPASGGNSRPGGVPPIAVAPVAVAPLNVKPLSIGPLLIEPIRSPR